MALFSNKERDDGAVAPREVEMFEREGEKNRPQDMNGTTAFLGKGSRVNGKVTFEGPARIEGQVEGEVTAQDTLVVGEGAVVKARITGTSIVVHGQVTGDITASVRLEIRAPSKVFGNLNTPSLVVHEGATFEGQCAMGGGAEARRPKKPESTPFVGGDAVVEAAPRAAASAK